MNKKSLASILSVLAIAGILSAQESVVLTKQYSSLDKKGDLNTTNPSLRSNMVFQENGGVQNGCFNLKAPVTVLLAKDPFMNIVNTSAPLSFKVKVKGKAQIRLSFFIYGKDKRYFTQYDKKETLDTNGEWKQLEFIFTPKASDTKYLANANFALSAIIMENGEILVDDWESEIKNPSAKITLEN